MRLIKPSTQNSATCCLASSSWLCEGRLLRERAAARHRGHSPFYRALTCMESPFRKASQSLNGSVHNTPGVKTTPVNASPVRPASGLCSAVSRRPVAFVCNPSLLNHSSICARMSWTRRAYRSLAARRGTSAPCSGVCADPCRASFHWMLCSLFGCEPSGYPLRT